MKLIHLADLHLGKRVCEMSMLDDQRDILDQILTMISREQADVVLIAGDVYDRPVPPPEAVQLLDEFLTSLGKMKVPCLMIPGNHDSDERLAFGARLLGGAGVYLAPVFDGTVQTVTLRDAYGDVQFALLPFLRPAQVRRYFDTVAPGDYEDAIRTVLETIPRPPEARHVLLAHQFVTAIGQDTLRCDSEAMSVGTLDHIDVSLFDGFDYVALGHIHGPQRIGRDTVRYAGSPLKFSFSEARHKKSVPLITLGEKGDVQIELLPLRPKRDLREKKGALQEILHPSPDENTEDYLHITLTDEAVMDAMNKVRTVYPNTLRLDFENAMTALEGTPELDTQPVKRDPVALFADFYEQQNGQKMEEEMSAIVREMFEEIGGMPL